MGKLSKTLLLERSYQEQATHGVISTDGIKICYSIELPWRNNARRLSCIPEGKYLLSKKVFPKHGEQIAIEQVLHREAILIHAGNDVHRDLQGCIAPVSKIISMGKGSESRLALERLKAVVYAFWDQGCKVYLHIIKQQSGQRK